MSRFRTRLVEFFGMPRTGKTTTVEALVHSLKAGGYNVAIIKERATLCPIKEKMSPLFNYWTALSQMKEYVEACDRGVELLIADRGILDSAVWLNYKNRSGEYAEEVRKFMPLLENGFMNPETVLAIWFTADVELILKREFHRRLKSTPGTVMNREVLEGYSRTYRCMKHRLEQLVPIYEIDTTNLDIPTTLMEVCARVDSSLSVRS